MQINCKWLPSVRPHNQHLEFAIKNHKEKKNNPPNNMPFLCADIPRIYCKIPYSPITLENRLNPIDATPWTRQTFLRSTSHFSNRVQGKMIALILSPPVSLLRIRNCHRQVLGSGTSVFCLGIDFTFKSQV